MPTRKPKNIEYIYPEFQPLRVKYKDIFDMKAFYTDLREYLLEMKWQDHHEGLDHWEIYYGERVDQSKAKEIWIHWRIKKKPDGLPKITYYQDLEFHVLGLTDAEVIRDGMKLKANKGEMELKIWAYLIQDYISEFEKHWFLKEFSQLFQKRIYRREIEQQKKQLYQEVYALQNFIKQWLKMKRYLPYEETRSFYPSQAWPSHMK